MSLQPDGRIVVAGLSQIGAYNQFAILRFNPDGSLDASYGTGGKVVISFNSGANEMGNAVALDSLGRAVIAGDAGGRFGVARFLGNPSLSMALTTMKTVRVSWPSGYAGWNLQQKTSLSSPTWGAPSEAINDDGTNSFIIVNSPAGNRFFRLVSP